ncbi:hypothetical protein HRE53_13330 [Acaryochloris sp. 'Moss Beach']|uniref:hypothetical protein n=1 Tax=Acaryochloris sp. 'Moss Beach' TaxID=2740837 RepID=UPI001F34CA1D|nr:hypothetical protein [Acaryochloris sp. 'Moss Beach']UJB67678.1 hypothetical protein HRE53_13330 [Acaryochloris sp. 'Moss Beach']
MLLRSQDSQVSAIAQKDTAKSLNAAETGVNEIRNLINDYRELAAFPACEGSWDSNNLCLDNSSIKSWKNPNNIANPFLGCALDDNTKITNIAKRTVWHNVGSSVSSQGEYRLLDYNVSNFAYNPATNALTATGTLTVQGRVNTGEPSESMSQLEVRFPVHKPTEPSATPGLWVQTSANTDEIKADILAECNNSITTQRITAVPTPGYQARQLDLSAAGISMPSVPSEPDGVKDLPPPPTGYDFTTLPLNPLELPDDDGVYRYRINNLNHGLRIYNNDSSKSLVRVELWIDGDINLQGQRIQNLCGTRSDCNALTVKIYGLGTSKTITLDKGTVVCDTFILAPAYQVSNTDTGSINSNECSSGIKNTGIFWVDSWANSGSIRTPVLDPPRETWAAVLNDSNLNVAWDNPNQPYPPQLGPIQSWTTQSIQP